MRHLGPEAARNSERREREGFTTRYLSGRAILDIGYRGSDPASQPVTEHALGIELDHPGYDGKSLPFPDGSQDAVFTSHVLEHIEDWAGALADWYRVLKINGYLVIAVPHRDLYERKADLPSRFNADHKRFYTPARLLTEVELALPVGGYRIRSLKDVDDGFDYTIPPERHAAGCYEIELVLEKIQIPNYASVLRPSRVSINLAKFYANLLQEAVVAQRQGDGEEVKRAQDIISAMPLVPFSEIDVHLRDFVELPQDAERRIELLRSILEPVIARHPFDEASYLAANSDVAQALTQGALSAAHDHFVRHGYFEGRSLNVNIRSHTR